MTCTWEGHSIEELGTMLEEANARIKVLDARRDKEIAVLKESLGLLREWLTLRRTAHMEIEREEMEVPHYG